MDSQTFDPTLELFLDNDTTRHTTGHQPVASNGQPPVPDYERILTVTCPVDIHPTTNQNRTRWNLSLNQDRLAEITPIHTDYLPYSEIDEDTILQTWLFHDLPTLNGPQLTGSGRQLINVDDPLLVDLSNTGVDPDRLNRLKPVLDAHERDPTANGSHADTILDHRSRTSAVNHSIGTQLSLVARGEVRNTSILAPEPSVYQELMAILSERRAAPSLTDRQALDTLRRDSGHPEYILALDILNWLRTTLPHRLSYTQITDLFHYCRFSTVPDKMLMHFLADLSHGLHPQDVPYHSSYFNQGGTTTSPTELYNEQRQEDIRGQTNSILSRLWTTTFETIRLEGDRDAPQLVKEWWSYDPPAVVAPMVIRKILFLRRLHAEATNNDYSLVHSTTNKKLGSSQNPAVAFRYQMDGNPTHPLREAMNITDPPDIPRLQSRFSGKPHNQFNSGKEAYEKVWAKTGNSWMTTQTHFSDSEEFTNWLTGDAPTGSNLLELYKHYL